MHKKVSEIPRF